MGLFARVTALPIPKATDPETLRSLALFQSNESECSCRPGQALEDLANKIQGALKSCLKYH